MIKRIIIKNYRCFENFDMEFNEGMNILVGDNDTGKSTLLEAVNLALTFRLGGRMIAYDVSPYLFNQVVTGTYCAALRTGSKPSPPEFIIDLFLDDTADTALLRGSNNLDQQDAVGVRVRAHLSAEFVEEYNAFVEAPDEVNVVPTEYYNVEWLGFSGNAITGRSIPVSASLIDASSIRLQTGADYYLQNIISQHLDRRERVELSRTYRSLREQFSGKEQVQQVNTRLQGDETDVTDRELTLAIDISQRFTWESTLVPHLDDLPFQLVGKGEQNTLKILLALNRGLEAAHVVLIEEPENHLSFSTLNMLISKVANKCKGKQVLVTTHSSYVLNKLGLDSLILINRDSTFRMSGLSPTTEEYFKKLSGYDTLRLVLAREVILVEGPSDELVVQRAYRDAHGGRMPIDDGIDVINVRGLSAQRFLDLAIPLKRRCRVVTDNDGQPHEEVEATFAQYAAESFITVHVGKDPTLPSLEPQLLGVNDRATLNTVFGTSHQTDEKLLRYMRAKNNKASCALKIFESDSTITMPSYIRDAVAT